MAENLVGKTFFCQAYQHILVRIPSYRKKTIFSMYTSSPGPSQHGEKGRAGTHWPHTHTFVPRMWVHIILYVYLKLLLSTCVWPVSVRYELKEFAQVVGKPADTKRLTLEPIWTRDQKFPRYKLHVWCIPGHWEGPGNEASTCIHIM
jgi:hypothetical protein